MADQTYIVEFKDSGAAKVIVNIRNMGNQAGRTDKSVKSLTSRLKALYAVGAGILAGRAIRNITEYADQWTSLNNKIKIVTNTEKELIDVRTQLLDISRKTRSSIEGNVTIYQRLTLANRNLKASQKDIIKFTEATSNALAISGATGEETRAVLIQLAQGLGSVAVRGDELRSVMENAPRLLKAVSDATGLTTGEIKKLTEEGKFLSKDFFQAVLSQSEQLISEFGKTAAMFSQIKEVFRNVWSEIIGGVATESGALKSITDGLLGVADKMRESSDYLTAAVMTARDILGDLFKEKGFFRGIVEIFKLSAEIFWEYFVLQFNATISIFKSIGSVIAISMADTFADKFGITLKSPIERMSEDMRKALLDSVSDQDLANAISSVVTSPAAKALQTLGLVDINNQFLDYSKLKTGDPFTQTGEKTAEFDMAVYEANQLVNKIRKSGNKLVIEQLVKQGSITKDQITKAFAGIDVDNLLSDMSKIGKEFGENVMGRIDAISESVGEGGTYLERYSENLAKIRGQIEEIIPPLEDVKDLNFDLFRSISEAATKFTDSLRVAFEDTIPKAIQSTSDELASLVVNGKADFKSMARSIVQDLISMMIQAQITNALLGLTGGTGKAFGMQLVPGAAGKQFGGIVSQGVPVPVGERGPEVFVPQSAGRIVPNGQIGGEQQPINVRINNMVDGDAILQSSSNSVVDKMIFNSIARNSKALRGVLA